MHLPPTLMANVLIVDDELKIAKGLTEQLRPFFHKVFYACTYETGLDKSLSEVPDMLCIDMNLREERTGFELCREIRKSKPTIPILLISGGEYTVAWDELFALGLCDYVTKPYHPDEIIFRIQNLMLLHEQMSKHTFSKEKKSIRIEEDFEVDYQTSTLLINGEKKHLPRTLRYLLQLFLENKNEILSHQFLHEKIWGDYYELEKNREIRSHTKRLRSILGEKYGAHLVNIKSQGYMFKL